MCVTFPSAFPQLQLYWALIYKTMQESLHILSNKVLVSQAACGLFLEHLITQEIEEEADDEMKMLYFKLD